ncbi:MAG: 50S ribosomal protein L24 [Candidatus Falkowbacteria bacterium]
MNIKKNDNVKVLTGKDRGKSGKILQVMPEAGKVSVEGLNLLIKHLRPSKRGEKGQRIEFPSFVNASNVAVVCPKCGKTTRIAYKIVKSEDGKSKKYRVCKKCEQSID